MTQEEDSSKNQLIAFKSMLNPPAIASESHSHSGNEQSLSENYKRFLIEKNYISFSSEYSSYEESSVDAELQYVPKEVDEIQAQPKLNAFESCALFRKADQSNLLELKMLIGSITEK